jgi:hypothetical protein
MSAFCSGKRGQKTYFRYIPFYDKQVFTYQTCSTFNLQAPTFAVGFFAEFLSPIIKTSGTRAG